MVNWENHLHLVHDGNTIGELCYCVSLWLFNIAMENGPFIDGLPITNGDFPWLC
jgi:hypothetical protein